MPAARHIRHCVSPFLRCWRPASFWGSRGPQPIIDRSPRPCSPRSILPRKSTAALTVPPRILDIASALIFAFR